jgi:uncharacterized protein YgiM (DUF1202 family)
MTCRYCGKQIPDGAASCPFCGRSTESHLRKEDLEKEIEKSRKNNKKEKKYEYEEPAGKRRLKSFLSIIAAMIFVAAAFIAIMVFVKPYLGEEPWSDKKTAETEADQNAGFPKNMYISTEDGLLLWEEPGTEGKAIHLINYGREIQVDKVEDGWAYTTVDGLSGWCSAEFLTDNKDEIQQTEFKPTDNDDKGQLVEPSRYIENGYHGTVNAEDGLNLRCGPGSDYDILLVIPYKTEVIEEGWNAGWLYVSYDGRYGWINSEYITPSGEVE